MKNTKSLIIGLICSIMLMATASADVYPNQGSYLGSIFTPDRPSVEYYKGIPGFSFPTFNNFRNNPNVNDIEENGIIYENQRKGHERIFTLAQHCVGGSNNCQGDYVQNYFDMLPEPSSAFTAVDEGDVVRFELYFHNNGEDLYDSNPGGAQDAVNVEMGIDLDDIETNNPGDVRPNGFIYADNNQYINNLSRRTDNIADANGYVADQSLLIKDGNGNVIRTASDDVKVVLADPELELKPVNGNIDLWVKIAHNPNSNTFDIINSPNQAYDPTHNVYYEGPIDGSLTLNFETPEGLQEVNFTVHYSEAENKVWVHVDKIPGCFRYSGYIYFEAIAERPPDELEPICAELLVDHHDPILTGTYSKFNSQANDTDGNNFASDIRYWVDPGYGTLSLNPPTNVMANPSDYIFERMFQFMPMPIQVQLYTLKEAANQIAETGLFGNVAHAAILEPAVSIGELFGGNEPQIFLNLPDVTELIVSQGTPVYFTAFKPGIHGVVHMETVDSDVLTCARHFDIIPYRVCEEILVNHYETITDDGRLSQFEAVAENPAGDTFYGEITYSVDPGYGQFFETKPAGYEDNTSQYIIEFDASQPIEQPVGGWCQDDGEARQVGPDYIFPNDRYDDLFEQQIMPDWYWQGVRPDIFGDFVEQREFDFDPKDVMLESQILELEIEPMSTIEFMTQEVILEGTMNESIMNESIMNESIMNESIMNKSIMFNSILHTADAEVIDANTIRVLPGETVWFLPAQEGTDVVHVYADCTDVADCGRDFSIERGPEDNACETLTINSSTLPLELSPTLTTTLTATGTDLNGNPLPADTQLQWTTTTVADFSYYPDNDPTQTQVTNQSHIVAKLIEVITANNFQVTGVITVAMADNNDPLYSAICTDSIPVTELLICTDLSVLSSGSTLVDLNPGQSYKLTADATYAGGAPVPEEVTYTTTQGVLMGPVPAGLQPTTEALIAQFLEGIIDSNYLSAGLPANILSQLNTTLTVPDGSTVYFIAFTDATGANALTVQATNRSEAPCIKRYNMAAENVPCQSIQVVHIPVPYDPLETNIITVTPGDYGDWIGKFKFSAPNGTFSVPGDNPKTSFTQAEASGGIVYIPGTNATENDEIEIRAVGNLSGTTCNYLITPNPEDIVCVDLDIVEPSGNWTEDDFTSSNEQRFEIEVTTNPTELSNNFTYLWDVLEGNATFMDGTTSSSTHANPLVNYLEDIDPTDDHRVSVCALDEVTNDCIPACEDEIGFVGDDEEEPPEIVKVVFDNDSNEWEDLINLGGREDDQNGDFIDSDDEWVTYMSVFIPNDAEDDVRIWDESLHNGIIESDTVGGEFGFLGMLIAVEGTDGDEYIIYQDDAFNRGRFSNEEDILPDEIEDFEGYGDDNDDLQDEYDCSENNDDRVCIYGHNDTEADFQDGDKIKLGNLDTAENIYIFYQMRNGTYISNEFCETMIEDYGICGEEYENEINFETPDDDGDYDEGYQGDADAKVIIICPYILTREGGDVFFHSALDTGIDVSECYEIEGGEGPGIQPVPEVPGDTPSTGTSLEDLGTEIIAPTHDICKVSNSDDLNEDLSAYRNVLKNFSSSVCEMQTAVAEQWKELHINNAIEANIEKISRFGSPVTVNTSNINTVTLNNGIFLTTADLTIPTTGFNVSGGAQTYIIDGRGADTPPVLRINGNITYNDVNVDITDPTTIPSVAFVVIDGNIEIAKDVSEISGVYLAVDTEGHSDGEIMASGGTSYQILTVHGSLVGDIYNLFLNRRGTGDPLKNESSITVIYDARILENIAPGLTELIDINQLRFAN